ncbi:hypothetical protein TNIN_69391 [Trichonephila inaurata madagascariensis]|uniref:Uncharacterized protein n=1 Tax=Trichonephila inaurata madagascariensis TaxID=2747483 RepID=A0A8X6Y027_9ARAC|nr:hypothetical protein TNIN_69391 [Trichonephila inaurata madagascariensis]
MRSTQRSVEVEFVFLTHSFAFSIIEITSFVISIIENEQKSVAEGKADPLSKVENTLDLLTYSPLLKEDPLCLLPQISTLFCEDIVFPMSDHFILRIE